MHSGEINWRAIMEQDEQRKLYNKYLFELTSKDMTYDNFYEAVVQAGRETATSIENKCEGWYMASEDILTPAIKEKNRLIHQLHDKHLITPVEIEILKTKLKDRGSGPKNVVFLNGPKIISECSNSLY